MSSEHFFRDSDTYKSIARLATPGKWTLYVGLGGTIDRTDTSWSALVVAMLKRSGVESGIADHYVRSVGEERAATTAEILLKHRTDSNDDFLASVGDSIKDALYGPRKNMAGRLLQSIALFAYANASAGGSTLIVTPNYDEYLHVELQTQLDRFIKRIDRSGRVRLNPLQVAQGRRIPKLIPTTRTVTLLHVHGHVPSRGAARGVPVIGELTYNMTRPNTVELLSTAFSDRDLLVVGSSLTDGPLCDALITSKSESTGRSRYAVMPKQDARFIQPGFEALVKARYEALGITPITPDHFGQVGQFLHEAAGATVRRDGEKQKSSGTYSTRYDSRLRKWWSAWQKVMEQDGAQLQHHKLLAYARETIRDAIEAPAGEELKVEIWSREDPNHKRLLRLWATSIGPWNDSTLSHKAELDPQGPYFAARTLCAGSPQTHEEDEDYKGRWRTYFGVPIWRDQFLQQLPIGVVLISSMRPYPVWHSDFDGARPSSIADLDMRKVQVVREYLESVGTLIFGDSSRRQADLVAEFKKTLGTAPRGSRPSW